MTGNNLANALRGGGGVDTLAGGKQADTYLCNVGDGKDTITDDGTGNKLIFLAPSGVTYSNNNFVSVRGNLASGSFTEGTASDDNDLQITVGSDSVTIVGYFNQEDNDAYTIYYTSIEGNKEVRVDAETS